MSLLRTYSYQALFKDRVQQTWDENAGTEGAALLSGAVPQGALFVAQHDLFFSL